MKKFHYTWIFLGLFATINTAHADGFNGQYLATGNFSTQSQLMPSLNHRLTATYVPSVLKGNFDFRLERYTENSYHTTNGDMTRERKFEAQVNFNYPLSEHFTATVGMLRHENYTFRDNYNWAVTGLSWSENIADGLSLTTTLLAEKRNGSDRIFYDCSGTAEQHFNEEYGVFISAHIYQNLGEFDTLPSRKREFEMGFNDYISKRYFAGISYFYHQQVGDPNDRFSFVKIKFGVNF